MNRTKVFLVCTLTAGLVLFSGCQQAATNNSDTETSALSSQTESNTAFTSGHDIKSTVLLDDTYWSGSNIRVRMLFDRAGNCKYGYIGKYDLQTTADGTPILTFIYYADSEKDQMASSSFALRDNGDGTYSKTVYTEGEEPDFDDATFTTDLTPDEGTDGLMNGAAFDGVYLSTDGQYYTFNADGTFAMETWMTYVADEDHMEIIGSDESTLYTYEANSDFSKITLYKGEKKVMDLATEAAIEDAK